ncbi:MAG: thiamine phosphate synthase [Prevotella sp.]|nr:thiamine phosphate synthase [Bacteroides sp.]MCM1365894.1 thiamine phosphate synthase [Prevotella sp.]
MLQFITNGNNIPLIVEQVKEVLGGGCRWIQLRMKEASDDDIRKTVEQIKPLCQKAEAFLIINDRVDLCKELGLSGVHLGKTDMLPSKARMELGGGPVIGVTANTIEDVIAVRSLDIDYIGIGPFRYTETKKNLAPVLGIEGIKSIVEKMMELEIEIPTVAVGGIKTDDVTALMDAGVRGIAVSGAIAHASNMVDETRKFISLLAPYDKSGSTD